MALENTPFIGTGVIDKIYPNMKGGVDTATNRPYNMDQMDVDDGLEQKTFWETTLRMTSVLNDVFESSLTEVAGVTGKGLSIPNSIGIKLTGQGQSGTYTFPILDPLVGSPRAGTGENLMGYERGQRMRYTSAYYNEIKDGVIQDTYGVNYNKIEIFGMYQQITSQLNNFWKEVKGRMKREALVATVEEIPDHLALSSLRRTSGVQECFTLVGEIRKRKMRGGRRKVFGLSGYPRAGAIAHIQPADFMRFRGVMGYIVILYRIKKKSIDRIFGCGCNLARARENYDF
jgi:hypothetical protein